jgi:hypothetical protein
LEIMRIISRHILHYMHGMLSLGTSFADGGGNITQWMWLKALTVLDRKWSWGLAALPTCTDR